MMKFIQYAVFVAIMALAPVASAAQKIAHFDTAALLASMPETKAAEIELETLKKRLQDQLRKEETAIAEAVQELKRQAETNELTAEREIIMKASIERRQYEINNFAGDADRLVTVKRAELMNAIHAKIRAALMQVVKEHGYNYVFDTNDVWYADPADNITSLLQKKLTAH